VSRRPDPSSLLRWYPAEWRARYGDELVALIEDQAGDHPLTSRARASIALAGLRQRAVGVIGPRGESPADRLRGGSLLVLWGWAAVILGGIGYQKVSEHFADVLSPSSRLVPQAAFDTIVVLAVLGAAIVLLAAAATMPAFVAELRRAGWEPLSRPAMVAVAATVVGLAASVGVVLWAHHLPAVQRNGTGPTYPLAVAAFALLVAAVLVLWTRVATVAARRLQLSDRTLRFEGALAVALAGVMVLIVVATALWWGEVATNASWFLAGPDPTRPGTAVPPNLAVSAALMLAGAVVAGLGVRRIAGGWRRLGTPSVASADPGATV
jgi:hypothetical protein